MKTLRSQVYAAIDTERNYQDLELGNAVRAPDQPVMTAGEFLLCMEECLAQGRARWYRPGGETACLDFVRKVAALGVSCMELHGAPYRLGADGRPITRTIP